MVKCMGCTLGRVIAQVTLGATPAVHGLIGFLNFIFYPKQAKMYFVFKLSFLLHHVTNQNFKKKKKKKRKISYHKQDKNRE